MLIGNRKCKITILIADVPHFRSKTLFSFEIRETNVLAV